MTPRVEALWVYLGTTPLLGLTITLLVYQLAYGLYQRVGFNPLANPVAVSIVLLAALLTLTGTPYATYFEGAQFVHFLLGPATVALAVPLVEQLSKLRRLALPLLAGLVAGTAAATASALGLAWWLGASPATLASLAPKSVTTPVAMGIADKVGGIPSLTAVLVVSTGVLGAVCAKFLFDGMSRVDTRFKDHRVRGFALGVTAHGIGTARAFQVSEVMGTYAGLAMGLTALVNAFTLPWVLQQVMATQP